MRIRSLMAVSLILLTHGVAASALDDVRVVFVRDGVFTSPVDPAWAAIPESSYELQPQMIVAPVGGGSVTQLSVRATHDGEEVAIRLSWADPNADRGVGVNTFRDAAAIGFPVGRPDTQPSPFMGDEEHPVVIWQWAADFDANAEGRSRFGDRYPHAEGVWIFPQDLDVRRRVRGWRGADPVIEYIARGFGTLTPRIDASVAGISQHKDGRWSVVLRRKLVTSNETDAAFVPGETTPFILAVWNGDQEEVNGRKSVNYAWITANFDPIGSATTKSDVGVSMQANSHGREGIALGLDRARVYRALAQLFRKPDAESLQEARERNLPELCEALERLTPDSDLVAEAKMLRDLVASAEVQRFDAAHHTAFDESSAVRCAPTEMDQLGGAPQLEMTRTFEMADVSGFYKAFGVAVEPSLERPDHIAAELEFMNLLAVKECLALQEEGEGEHADVCRNASRSFLRDHLGRWAPRLGEGLAAAAGDPIYASAGRLLGSFIVFDAEKIDAANAPDHRLRPELQGQPVQSA